MWPALKDVKEQTFVWSGSTAPGGWRNWVSVGYQFTGAWDRGRVTLTPQRTPTRNKPKEGSRVGGLFRHLPVQTPSQRPLPHPSRQCSGQACFPRKLVLSGPPTILSSRLGPFEKNAGVDVNLNNHLLGIYCPPGLNQALTYVLPPLIGSFKHPLPPGTSVLPVTISL